MSLDIVRQVNAEHPELLQTNIGSTCHQFTQFVIEKLRAQNHLAHLMCKTQGEGQYVPFGFQPRDVVGLDGKVYRCTGVSHDAIWCDGNQFDTIASANEEDHPIYTDTGAQIQGRPVWNAISPQFWRNQNPPLKGEPVHSPPQTPTVRIPSYAELGDDAFFRAMIGVPLFADYLMAGQSPNDGMSVWFSRATYRLMAAFLNANGKPIDAAGEVRIVRNEWRAILGLPQL